jgi:hypothetical protein
MKRQRKVPRRARVVTTTFFAFGGPKGQATATLFIRRQWRLRDYGPHYFAVPLSIRPI